MLPAFVGMVLLGDKLSVNIKHIGMHDSNMLVKVQTLNSQGEKVLEGTAEVAQPVTVYVFTGQCSQEPCMGMELYIVLSQRAPFGMVPILISLPSMGSLSLKSSRIIPCRKRSILVASRVKPSANGTQT